MAELAPLTARRRYVPVIHRGHWSQAPWQRGQGVLLVASGTPSMAWASWGRVGLGHGRHQPPNNFVGLGFPACRCQAPGAPSSRTSFASRRAACWEVAVRGSAPHASLARAGPAAGRPAGQDALGQDRRRRIGRCWAVSASPLRAGEGAAGSGTCARGPGRTGRR